MQCNDPASLLDDRRRYSLFLISKYECAENFFAPRMRKRPWTIVMKDLLSAMHDSGRIELSTLQWNIKFERLLATFRLDEDRNIFSLCIVFRVPVPTDLPLQVQSGEVIHWSECQEKAEAWDYYYSSMKEKEDDGR